MSKEWIFVIDTEKYAGNFERSMCAFMTGMVGECMVGAEEARLFYEQTGVVEKGDWSGKSVEYSYNFNNPFEDFVLSKSDENGCHRPCSHWSTPGWFGHGMGGCFKDGQEKEAAAHYKKACIEYAAKKVHPNDQAAHEERWKKNAENPLSKSYASLSVAIFFQKEPTEELINIMINRAKAYVDEYRLEAKGYMQDSMPDKITGFRLLMEETVQTEENSWEA